MDASVVAVAEVAVDDDDDGGDVDNQCLVVAVDKQRPTNKKQPQLPLVADDDVDAVDVAFVVEEVAAPVQYQRTLAILPQSPHDDHDFSHRCCYRYAEFHYRQKDFVVNARSLREGLPARSCYSRCYVLSCVLVASQAPASFQIMSCYPLDFSANVTHVPFTIRRLIHAQFSILNSPFRSFDIFRKNINKQFVGNVSGLLIF